LLRHAAFYGLDEFDKQEIAIRTSLVEKKEGFGEITFRHYTHTPELLAVQELTTVLSAHNVELKTEHFYSTGVTDKYLLLLGTDANNRLSQHMLKDLGAKVKWIPSLNPVEGHPSFNLFGIPYTCHDEHGKVCVDHGLVVRRTRPNGGVTLLCAGIHAFGTYAAARVAMRKDFQKFVKCRKTASFAQLVKVEVLDGEEIHDGGISWDSEHFTAVSPIP